MRILISKSFGISNLVYSFSNAEPYPKIVKQAQTCINEFVWNRELHKVRHDVMIAQEKASIALQYTVQLRDSILDAYNEIMRMQV